MTGFKTGDENLKAAAGTLKCYKVFSFENGYETNCSVKMDCLFMYKY